MIKIFQFRHPDRNRNAHIAFFMFSFVVFITLLGIVSHTKNGMSWLWPLLLLLHLCAVSYATHYTLHLVKGIRSTLTLV